MGVYTPSLLYLLAILNSRIPCLVGLDFYVRKLSWRFTNDDIHGRFCAQRCICSPCRQ